MALARMCWQSMVCGGATGGTFVKYLFYGSHLGEKKHCHDYELAFKEFVSPGNYGHSNY